MALVLKDRVKETTTTTGTGTYTLAGAVSGFEAFSEVGDGNTTYYCCTNGSDFEIGIGTYTLSGTTLARTTILQSSNGDAAVNWAAGTRDIFITEPAEKMVFENASNDVTVAGQITVAADPTANLQVATKQYVDNLTAAAIHVHTAVRVEREGNLTATYDNGTAGVGATLTNSGTQAALVIDGVTLNTSDRVLVYEQTDQTQNGVYTVTNTGSVSTNWVLTRATDADTSGEGSSTSLDEGSYFYVQEGNAGAGESYVCNTAGTIVFGTTNITFAQFSATPEFTGGTNIDITNRVISVTGTVADSSLLDSLDSTQFLRSDAADTKTAGDLSFSDNVKAIFGAGSDLQIYHSGTTSYIYEQGTGDLRIRGSQVRIEDDDGSTIALFKEDAGVELRYDGAVKFESTATGVDVTGDVLTDTVTLDNGASDWKFSVVSNNLIISYGGVNKMKLDSSGNLTVVGDVTAFGTI
jgi:hypothetical protein